MNDADRAMSSSGEIESRSISCTTRRVRCSRSRHLVSSDMRSMQDSAWLTVLSSVW